MEVKVRSPRKTATKKKWSVLIHGGVSSTKVSTKEKEIIESELKESLEIAVKLLESGESSVKAVEFSLRYLESSKYFNAGLLGSAKTEDGTIELEASIMEGSSSLSYGTVMRSVDEHPISVAREIMKGKYEPYFVICETPDEVSPGSRERSESKKSKKVKNYGTVGCVALDSKGNLAAGTSTGGLQGKVLGRIGDSGIIGAGIYANNNTCALACSGKGEEFIRHVASYDVHSQMKYLGKSLKDAMTFTVMKTLPKNSGGMIGVDSNGNLFFIHNSKDFFIASQTSSLKQ